MKKVLLLVGVIIVTLTIVCAYSFGQPGDVSNPDASAYQKEDTAKKNIVRSKQANAASQEMLLSGPVTLFPEAESEPGLETEPESELEPASESEPVKE